MNWNVEGLDFVRRLSILRLAGISKKRAAFTCLESKEVLPKELETQSPMKTAERAEKRIAGEDWVCVYLC
jgi:hypothetical protein